MFELFQMWALVEVLGLVCLPLTITVCHNLPDRGWAFSKALGLALLAFLVWLPLMVLQFLPFSQLLIAGVALILCAGNILAFIRTRHAMLKWLRLNVSYIVATEVVFVGMILLLGWLRSYGPNIQSYEMFMDEGFIASIMRSTHFPPGDMWFAGYSINYYYYAHYVVAMLAKLLGQSPSVAFNTGICLYFGLTAVSLFGITCNITAWARQLRAQPESESDDSPGQVHPPLPGSIPYGLFTVLVGLILGNLAATQQWWQNHGADAHFDWFQQPTRVIDRTINEFPAFSFLLSCFHAHVLALAFTIVSIGLAFNLLLEMRGRGLALFGQGWQRLVTLFMTALVVGGLFVMNGWDYPTYMGLVLVCIGLQQLLLHEMRFSLSWVLDVMIPAICLVVLSFLLYLPFYLNFISPSLGLGIVTSVADRSQLRDELLIYGLFAFFFVSLLLVSALQRPLKRGEGESGTLWQLIYIVVLLFCDVLLFWLLPNSTVLVVFGSAAALGVLLLFNHLGDRSHAFTLLLGSLAFALVAGCEVFFLKDVFVYQNFARMNTVFKFYFQAWALLAITSGCGLYFILQGFRSIRGNSLSTTLLLRWSSQGLWGLLLLLFLLAGSVYPLLAPYERYAQFNAATNSYGLVRSNSLDGLTYLQTFVGNEPQPQKDPNAPKNSFLYNAAGDYAAIRWLNEHVSGDPVIIEAVGDDYTFYGRVSSFTGLPTLMGWVGHEYQWRVNWLNNEANAIAFNRRTADLDSIYTNPQPDQVLSILKQYNAQYIYVGPLEYGKYPNIDLKRFSAFMQTVYDAQGVTIYKVR